MKAAHTTALVLPRGGLLCVLLALLAVLNILLKSVELLSSEVAHSRPHVLVNSPQKLPSSTLCDESRLYINETRMQIVTEWGYPVLSTAMRNPETQETYVMFRFAIVKNFPLEDERKIRKQFLDASWHCNGLRAAEPYPARWAHDRSCRIINMILIKCPRIPEGELSNVTVSASGSLFVYNDLEDFFHCQIQGHPATAVLEQPVAHVLSKSKNTTKLLPHVVFSVMIKGPESQAYLPQWIEYHRYAFGIPHFFVYVNEPWQVFCHRKSYREWSFVTYVPFPLGYYHDDEFYYQRIQQNDLFWRVKVLASQSSSNMFGSQIQWVGMLDIDEYLYAPGIKPSLSAEHLEGLLDKYSNPDTHKHTTGLYIRNTFYGGPDAHDFEWIDSNGLATDVLSCHFFYHHNPNVTIENWARQKFFARVDGAIYMNVHLVLSLDKRKEHQYNYMDSIVWLDHETELRHNHFKLNWPWPADQQKDLHLRDTVCPLMQKLLKQG